MRKLFRKIRTWLQIRRTMTTLGQGRPLVPEPPSSQPLAITNLHAGMIRASELGAYVRPDMPMPAYQTYGRIPDGVITQGILAKHALPVSRIARGAVTPGRIDTHSVRYIGEEAPTGYFGEWHRHQIPPYCQPDDQQPETPAFQGFLGGTAGGAGASDTWAPPTAPEPPAPECYSPDVSGYSSYSSDSGSSDFGSGFSSDY